MNNEWQLDVLDILFANRNKSYGAYQLRRNYNKRLSSALITMIGISVFLCMLYKLKAAGQPTTTTDWVSDVISLKNVPPKLQPPVVRPPQTKPHTEPVHLATIKVTPPVLVDDKLVTQPSATQDDMDRIQIDITATDGVKTGIIAPPVNEGTGSAENLIKKENYDTEFYIVQQQAQFPGGLDAWRKFVERNLRSSIPTENGAAVGSYTVIVSFLVNKTGAISEVKAENDPGYGTAAEAVRVIQRGPAWTPAVQNGRNVIYRQKQQITFVVAD